MPAAIRPLAFCAPASQTGAGRPRTRSMARVWREAMGQIIAELRETAGLTGTELAEVVGMGGRQAISKIETGDIGIPPERVAAFANALGVDRAGFSKVTLRYSDPWRYAEIFGTDETLEAELAEARERVNLHRGPAPRTGT